MRLIPISVGCLVLDVGGEGVDEHGNAAKGYLMSVGKRAIRDARAGLGRKRPGSGSKVAVRGRSCVRLGGRGVVRRIQQVTLSGVALARAGCRGPALAVSL